MTALGRRERLAVSLWLIVAVVVWNGLYDLLLARSIKEYLFRAALHDAGRGPWVDLTSAARCRRLRCRLAVDVVGRASLLLAGLVTIRLVWPRARAMHPLIHDWNATSTRKPPS